MQFIERTYRTAPNVVVIQSKLGPAVKRRGLERTLLPSIHLNLPGWQRAHSQGAGTGAESAEGIRYAPAELNQAFQRLGIERYLKDLEKEKPSDVVLWLTTVTSSHPGTLRLKEIQYRLDAVKGDASRRLFEASINVENRTNSPKISIDATPFSSI